MSTITEFLLARVAEDETEAREAVPEQESVYGTHGFFEPTRVLAECAAKRAIIVIHGSAKDEGWKGGADNDHLWCTMCGSIDDSPAAWPCDTLKALAAIYSDHPDYQPDWAL